MSHYLGDERDPTDDYESQGKEPYRHFEARPTPIP